MLITMNEQRRVSKNYMGTVFDRKDSELLQLKQTVAEMNARGMFGTNGYGERGRKRVVLRPRCPKVKLGKTAYNHGGNLIGGMSNAQRFDVYIYDRRD